MTAWVEVLVTMADGPSLPIRGVIRKTPDAPERINFATVGESEPMIVGVGSGDVRIWRDRSSVRVETLDGQPLFVTDGETAWQFGPPDEPPLRNSADRVCYLGTGSDLLFNRPAHDWLRADHTRPAGPIEEIRFLGRDCWAVDLAPGPHKSGVLRIVVDRESGAVLEQRNDASGFRVSYVELEVGATTETGLFTWSGPARDHEEVRREQAAEQRAEHERRLEWFRDNVSDRLPIVQIPVPLRVLDLHSLDAETGAFQASVTGGFVSGMLARRPRSNQPWNLLWHNETHRWSTEEFDWAATLHDVVIDAGALGALQATLHPGQAAVNGTA